MRSGRFAKLRDALSAIILGTNRQQNYRVSEPGQANPPSRLTNARPGTKFCLDVMSAPDQPPDYGLLRTADGSKCQPQIVRDPYPRVVDWGMPEDVHAGDFTFSVLEAALQAGGSEIQLTPLEAFGEVRVVGNEGGGEPALKGAIFNEFEAVRGDVGDACGPDFFSADFCGGIGEDELVESRWGMEAEPLGGCSADREAAEVDLVEMKGVEEIDCVVAQLFDGIRAGRGGA